MGVRHMHGVPAQIKTLKSADGIRRHPAHCIFAEGKGKNRICTSPQCSVYYQHCSSASKCYYYEDRNGGIN